MAIDPSSIQMLGMILDRRDRRDEMAADRGHDMTMMGLQSAQRNLENQIQMNFQRQRDVESQIFGLRHSLSEAGVDVSGFGSDSRLKDMSERIAGSLTEQRDQLLDIRDMQINELETLHSMTSAFSRGAEVALGVDPVFDDNLNVDPTSEFGRFRGALGNTDDMINLFRERGVSDIPNDPRIQQAFARGASTIFRDLSGALEEESARVRVQADRDQMRMNRLAEANIHGQQLATRMELSNMFEDNYADLLTGDVLQLTDPDMKSGDREAILDNMQERLIKGSESFTNQVALSSNIDLNILDDEVKAINERLNAGETISEEDRRKQQQHNYFTQVANGFASHGMNHITNLTMNPEAFAGSIERSIRELESALEEHGTFENVVANMAIDPGDLSNILGFVGNPFVATTIGGGFQKLNSIMNNIKAKDALMSHRDFSVATQKALDAMSEERGINVGLSLRNAMTDRMFPGSLGLEDGNDEESTGRIREWWNRMRGVGVQEESDMPEDASESASFEETFRDYDPDRMPIEDVADFLDSGLVQPLSKAKDAWVKSNVVALDAIFDRIKKVHERSSQDSEMNANYRRARNTLRQIKSGELSDEDLNRAIKDFEEAAVKIDPDSLSEYNVLRGRAFRRMLDEYKQMRQ